MTTIKLVKHLRPPATAAAAPPAHPQEGKAAPPAQPTGDLPSPSPQPSWGALSKRLMGQLAAVESDEGQPTMPGHSKTTGLQR